MQTQGRLSRAFSRLAQASSAAAGSSFAFALAVSIIIGWALLGPWARYSDTWQLVINTSTTIVTFLMVFLIQHAQNKDMRSIQMKLDELIGAVAGASNRLIDVEDLDDDQVNALYERYRALAASAAKRPQGAQVSVDEAEEMAAAADALVASARKRRHGKPRAKS